MEVRLWFRDRTCRICTLSNYGSGSFVGALFLHRADASQLLQSASELQNTRRNATCICRGFPTMEVIVPTAPLPIFAFG